MPNTNQQDRVLEPWELALQDDPLYLGATFYSRVNFNPNPIKKYVTTISLGEEYNETWEDFKTRVDNEIRAISFDIVDTSVSFISGEYPEMEIAVYRMETPAEATQRVTNTRESLIRQRDYRRQQFEQLRAEFEGQDNG